MHIYRLRTNLFGATALAGVFAGALGATAANAETNGPNQPAPPPSAATDQGPVDNIVITAERRETRLQNTPVSVTAFTSTELARRQINDVHDLMNSTPGATFSATPYGNSDMIIAIRGVAPGGVLPNVDQATATYVDGLYYARPELSNFALVDLARAEVLRGPQGTLFGRNSIGGALNITTNAPTDRFEGLASFSYGAYNDIEWTGILNMPLSDNWATRFVVSHVSHDGYAQDVKLGSPVADQNDNFLRATVKGDVTSKIKALVTVDYTDAAEHQPLWILDYLDPALQHTSPGTYNLLAPYLNTDHRRVSYADYNPINRSHAFDLTAKFSADLGWGTLTSITGYRELNFNGASDLTGTGAQVSDVLTFLLKGSQISQEIQLAGDAFDDRLHWLAGLYYFDEKIENDAVSASTSSINQADIKPNNSSLSAFGQFTYEFAPKWRLTGGVRYVYDTRSITYMAPHYALGGPLGPGSSGTVGSETEGAQLTGAALDINGISVPGALGCPTLQAHLSAYSPCVYTPPSIHFNYLPWTVGVDFKPTETALIYGKISQGFRSGGFQQAGGVAAAYYKPFNPESLLSYELGAKLSLLDHKITLNGAIYHSDYDNIQQNNVQIINSQPVIAVLNAGKASIDGGELEASALIDHLRLTGSVGIINPVFTSGPYKGSVVPTVAKQTYSLSADYPIDFSAGVLTLHVGYDYKSSVTFLNTINVSTGLSYSAAQIASVTQAGYGLLNAKISFDLRNAPITFSVWGKNLTDVFYAGRPGSYYGSFFNSIVIGDPATYGGTITYRFGG